MKRLLALVGLLAACASLPSNDGGVVALQLRIPATDTLTLLLGQADTLHAVALDAAGDSVAVPVYWTSSDTALLLVDSTQGIITSRVDVDTTAGVQAHVGTLRSDSLIVHLRQQPTAPPTSLQTR